MLAATGPASSRVSWDPASDCLHKAKKCYAARHNNALARGNDEAARVHRASQQRGGSVAARGARAATGDGADRALRPRESQATTRLNEAFGDPELLKYATLHRDIVVKFGRFPHRNRAIGRDTTPKEQKFLDGGGFAG